MASKVTFKDEIAKLPLPATEIWKEGTWDINCLEHGSMSLILFTPRGRDYQTTHEQDELYIVYKGAGQLVTPNGRLEFVPGDVLFVKAGEDHHFENFSDDLALWAIFWGQKGGEEVFAAVS